MIGVSAIIVSISIAVYVISNIFFKLRKNYNKPKKHVIKDYKKNNR